MKLKLDTRVNMVMFYDEKGVVCSTDINITFGDYVSSFGPKKLNKMMLVNYIEMSSVLSKDELGRDIKLTNYTHNGGPTAVYGFTEIVYV